MIEVNIETARRNMVDSQVRTWEVLDERVLELLRRAPREAFVPAAFRNLAFADMQIPLGAGQVMMTPKLEGRLLQALDIEPDDRILEIGTGSGWLTWLLASLGREVVSVEIVPELHHQAAAKLAAHGMGNATLELGDGARGWDRYAPYDAIVVTGSLPLLPESFQKSLAARGRLFAIIGRSPAMEARLIRRLDGGLESTTLFETDLPPLLNAPAPDGFVF